VVRYRGIRIGGLSGIYKSHDYYQSRNELPPYDAHQLRSIYHYRNVDVYRLSCLSSPGNSLLHDNTVSGSDHTNSSPSHIPHGVAPQRLDIMVSHDWPQGIEQYGDTGDLIRRKPFFQQEIHDNALGSPPAAQLLHTVQPSYWFAAHLHVKFQAQVVHPSRPPVRNDGSNTSSTSALPFTSNNVATTQFRPPTLVPTQVVQASTRQSVDPLSQATSAESTVASTNLTDEGNDVTGATDATELMTSATTQFVVPEANKSSCEDTGPDLTELMTRFLALDKCLPRRHYLSIVHLSTAVATSVENTTVAPDTPDNNDDNENESKLEYDLEWLAILRKTHHLAASTHPHRVNVPRPIPCRDASSSIQSPPHQVTDADIAWIRECIGDDCTIPENFVPTIAQKYSEGQHSPTLPPPLPRMGNPQTDQLLNLLQLEHIPNLTIPYIEQHHQQSFLSSPSASIPQPAAAAAAVFVNPMMDEDENEIDLGDDDTDDIPVVSSHAAVGDEPYDRPISGNDEDHVTDKEVQLDLLTATSTLDDAHHQGMKKPRLEMHSDAEL
jgi:lariat debranching enzyme